MYLYLYAPDTPTTAYENELTAAKRTLVHWISAVHDTARREAERWQEHLKAAVREQLAKLDRAGAERRALDGR